MKSQARTQIPFHERHITRIEHGVKQFTLRVDPGYSLDAKEEVELVDHRREPITTARITLVAQVEAHWIPHWDFDGHRNYRTTEELIEELAEYYPDADLDRNTLITVIGWEDGQ